MIKITAKSVQDYILNEDRGSDNPTVFKIKPLTMRQETELQNKMGEWMEREGQPVGDLNYKALKYGLVGWENLQGEDGEVKPEKDEAGYIKDELLELFTTEQRSEISGAIWNLGQVSEDDAKKSS